MPQVIRYYRLPEQREGHNGSQWCGVKLREQIRRGGSVFPHALSRESEHTGKIRPCTFIHLKGKGVEEEDGSGERETERETEVGSRSFSSSLREPRSIQAPLRISDPDTLLAFTHRTWRNVLVQSIVLTWLSIEKYSCLLKHTHTHIHTRSHPVGARSSVNNLFYYSVLLCFALYC